MNPKNSTKRPLPEAAWMIGLLTAAAGCLLAGCGPKDDGSTPKARIASLDSKDWQSRVDKVDVLAEAQNLQSLAMLRIAMKDSHPRVREAAIKALARRKAQATIPALAEAVKDPDEGVRVAAVEALQQFTGELAVSVVLLRLGTGSDRERQAARAGLSAQLKRSAEPDRRAAIQRLVILVKAERPGTQEDAANVLVQVGTASIEPVLDALAAARPGSGGAWIEQLEAVLVRQGKLAVPTLVAALRQAAEKEPQAAVAARILQRIGAAAVPPLLETLDGRGQHSLEAAELSEEVLVGLGALAVPAVTALLTDSLDHRRLAGVELLQRLKSPQATPALLALLDKEANRAIRLAAVRALGNSGEAQAIPRLLAALRKDSAGGGKLDAQEWAAYREALVALRAPAKDITPALSDPLPQVRLVAAQVAARLRLAEAAAALPALLKDREADVLGAAAHAAGELGAQAASPALRKLAYHKDITVRFRAVAALGRLDDPKALGDLAGAAGFRKSQAVITVALLSLGQKGAKAGLPPARKARYKSALVLRKAALWTLAKLEGKGAPSAPPTFCGLLTEQKQLCAKENPAGDAFLDLDSLCQFGDITTLESLVQASRCKEFQAGLGRIAESRGTELFTTHWGEGQGQKREQVRFLAGVRQGAIERWHANGKLQIRGTLLGGLRHGAWDAFWPSGKRRLRARFVNDRPDGTWERWSAGGARLEQGAYQNGQRHGVWTLWHDNGQKSQELTYDQGQLQGKQLSFYANGKPSGEAIFVKGRRHGPWVTWTPEGTKRSQGQYVAGLRHGAWSWYHPNGKPSEAGTFDKGQKTGVWTTWDAEGTVVERCDYAEAGSPRCGQ